MAAAATDLALAIGASDPTEQAQPSSAPSTKLSGRNRESMTWATRFFRPLSTPDTRVADDGALREVAGAGPEEAMAVGGERGALGCLIGCERLEIDIEMRPVVWECVAKGRASHWSFPSHVVAARRLVSISDNKNAVARPALHGRSH